MQLPDVDPRVAHIECGECHCQFQVLNAEGTDWDEAATITLRDQYVSSCKKTPCKGK